ncbi:sulfatase-like hydrolase/transferase [Micromonospora tarensis]|uniref:sulfatase-like hydrolase/transferase n=1 Tax=Micromonospora tarensis TaxID=2806100 RepID=UPI003899238A
MAITYRRLLAATLVAGLTLLAAWTPARGAQPAPPAPTATAPNIIFVLVDDLAWNLVRYLPQVQRLQNEGVTFTNYTATDSLCRPSRSSILTGQFPHDTTPACSPMVEPTADSRLPRQPGRTVPNRHRLGAHRWTSA